MKLINLLSQLNEVVDISKIPTKVVSQFIPKEKWNEAFVDILQRHGRSKFGSMTVSDMFKDPSEGWFFHYSDKYFEGQYSFQFVQTFGFKENLKIKNIVTDEDVSWNNGNFMVDSINKQVIIEKAWSRDRLITGHIEDMDEVKIALSIAVNRHPEIIDYKFNYPRMGLKKVSDALNVSSVGDSDSDIMVFWGTTEDGLRIAHQSKYENITCWFDSILAKGEIRSHIYDNPIEKGEAIVKLQFKSNDKRLKKNIDGSIEVSFITKNDIVSYKTSKNFDINKKIPLYKKYNEYSFLKYTNIYIVKDLEEFKSNYSHFIKQYFIYEVRDDNPFFIVEDSISNDQIMFSLCMIDSEIFSLRRLNLINWKNDEKILEEFFLNRNFNYIFKTFFDNLFGNNYKEFDDVNNFIDRIGEFLSK